LSFETSNCRNCRNPPEAQTEDQEHFGDERKDVRDETGHDAHGSDDDSCGDHGLGSAHVPRRRSAQGYRLQTEQKQKQPVHAVFIVRKQAHGSWKKQYPREHHSHTGYQKDHDVEIKIRLVEEKFGLHQFPRQRSSS
jgi:hypothetical protein